MHSQSALLQQSHASGQMMQPDAYLLRKRAVVMYARLSCLQEVATGCVLCASSREASTTDNSLPMFIPSSHVTVFAEVSSHMHIFHTLLCSTQTK